MRTTATSIHHPAPRRGRGGIGAALAMVIGTALVAGGCNYITGDLESSEEHGNGAALTGGADEGTDGGPADPAGEPPPDGGGGSDTDTDDDGAGESSGGTGGASTGTGADTGQGGQGSGCCEATTTPGCPIEPDTESCVCNFDPYCCTTAWDATCVQRLEPSGCGFCGDDGPSTDGESGDPGLVGPCCTETATPGCSDTGVETCVCDIDEQCCTQAWDSVCVDLVTDANCGACTPDPSDAVCCSATATAGCADSVVVEACVCDASPECCTTAWTQTCADLGAVLGCSACQPPPSPQPLDCCEHGVTGGCDDAPVQTCVCDLDPYCCNVLWDSACVEAVEEYACGTC